MMKKYNQTILWLLSLVLIGCASPVVLTAANGPADDYFSVRHDAPDNVEQRLRAEYQRWKNTPHGFGGNDLTGVDCSGLAHKIYKDLLNMSIPRSTATQINVGIPVKRADLKAGDLVFFKLPAPSYPRHVGIYLGDGEFLHASASKGVIISKLNSGYWHKHYHTARRHPLK